MFNSCVTCRNGNYVLSTGGNHRNRMLDAGDKNCKELQVAFRQVMASRHFSPLTEGSSAHQAGGGMPVGVAWMRRLCRHFVEERLHFRLRARGVPPHVGGNMVIPNNRRKRR